MASFKDWCGLPFVQVAIDCTQIHIHKPKGVSEFFPTNPKITSSYK